MTMRGMAALLALALLGAAPDPTPRVAIGPVGGGDWQVRYDTAHPARALHFELPYESYRQQTWRPVEPGVRFVTDGDAVRAERTDGRPFRTLSFRLTPRYREVPKNYAPFSPFSDGGLLVFTGQFHACADRPCGDAPRWRTSVRAPGRNVLAGGRLRKGEASFSDGGEGTLVYAGPAAALATPLVYAVIDPALPAALRAQLDSLLPPLMTYFTASFGALAEKPMLFASLDRFPRPDSGLSYQGGTLPGQVFLHFYGSDWPKPEAAAKADFVPWFFAHETAHFFHGARAGGLNASDDEAWIHEGGAEAFAALAVRHLGNPAYVEKRVGQAADRCAAGLSALGDKPLDASARAGALGNYYDCGLLLQLAIDADVRRASGGRETLVAVWTDFLDKARAGTPWTGAAFLAAARRHGMLAATAALVADLTEKPQHLSPADLRARLRTTGLSL